MSQEKKTNIVKIEFEKLVAQMQALKLVTIKKDKGNEEVIFNYASNDAYNFRDCIADDHKKAVLDKEKGNSYKPQMIQGTGAQKEYTLGNIRMAAKGVRESKRGTCQTFTALGADHLLNLMVGGKLAPATLKMVSHQDGRGSHTFLLLHHEGDDLTDLSKCLIIDPWAVVMGHWESAGIFTSANYPFDMLDNLKLVYDSSKDKEYLAQLPKTKPTIVSSSSSDNSSMFFHPKPQIKPEPLKPEMYLTKKDALSFIKSCYESADSELWSSFNQKRDALAEIMKKTAYLDQNSVFIKDYVLMALDVFLTPQSEIKGDNNLYMWDGKQNFAKPEATQKLCNILDIGPDDLRKFLRAHYLGQKNNNCYLSNDEHYRPKFFEKIFETRSERACLLLKYSDITQKNSNTLGK